MKRARFLAALGIVLAIGAAGIARLTIADRSLSPEQLAGVTSNCPRCHGSVSAYTHVSVVHSKHASFDCSRCHGASGTLAVTDDLHTSLKWVAVGVVAVVMTGLIANSFVVNRTAKGK